jgi:ribosomal protein S3AE
MIYEDRRTLHYKKRLPVYFRIEAHKGSQVGSGVTIFSDLELAKQYKQSLIEQQGYAASEIQIATTDEEGRAIQF